MSLIKTSEPTRKLVCPNNHPLNPLTKFEIGMGRDEIYCVDCGAKLGVEGGSIDIFRCSECNNQVNPTWQFCPYCGEKLAE